jgi:S1-C subfamily serine protease
MAASFRCPKCSAAFRVDDSTPGKTVLCPNAACRHKSILPKASSGDVAKPVSQTRRSSKAKYSTSEPVAAAPQEPARSIDAQQNPQHRISRETLIVITSSVAAILVAVIVGVVVLQKLNPARVDAVVNAPASPEPLTPEDAASHPEIPDAPTSKEESNSPVAGSKQMEGPSSETKAKLNDASAPEVPVVERLPTELLTVEQVVAKVEASVACIKVEGYTGGGSGFVIREGMIATNRHVIEKVLISQLQIYFPSAPMDQRGPFPAELIYVDPVKDIALLKVPTSIAPLTTPPTHTFRRGQEVIAIGSPGTLGVLTLENAVSRGVVSAEVVIEGLQYCQLSISINPGNSGGPALDMTGQVIGVITARDLSTEGVAFCITVPDLNNSIHRAEELTDEEIENNRSLHRLGVLVRAISKLTRIHGHLMGLYLVSMEKAVNDGKSVDVGLQTARGELDAVVRGLNAENAVVDSELTNEASSISSDEHLPERIREQFSALWTNYKEIRSNVENPRGTMDAFRTKKLQLTDTHERLMHSLNLHLGIKE